MRSSPPKKCGYLLHHHSWVHLWMGVQMISNNSRIGSIVVKTEPNKLVIRNFQINPNQWQNLQKILTLDRRKFLKIRSVWRQPLSPTMGVAKFTACTLNPKPRMIGFRSFGQEQEEKKLRGKEYCSTFGYRNPVFWSIFWQGDNWSHSQLHQKPFHKRK